MTKVLTKQERPKCLLGYSKNACLIQKNLCFSREKEFSKLPSKNKVAEEESVGGRQQF
jgi:hypothetical protein